MPSDLALSVRGLTKLYTIKRGAERHTTAAAAALARVRRPLRRPRHEQFLALDEVTFDLAQGDVLGVIGPNGAGKSTLLKVLSRVTAPTGGEAHVYGRVGSLLEVGTGFHPELTGRENIFLNGTILGMRRREIARRFDEIVDFAGVARFLDTPVKRYSSGMYVRLAFSVAAHLETDILLVDEVLAVGDRGFQRRSLGKLESAADSGRTIVFVSHSMETVARLCSSALLLVDGQVQALGPTRETIDRYVSDPAIPSSVWLSDERFAPGDGSVRLRGVRVTGDGRAVGSQFDIRDPIRIVIDYQHLADGGPSPLVSVMVTNSEGSVLFATNSHHAVWDGGPVSGNISAECEIPGNFLAEGKHLVTVMLNSHGSAHVYETDVVSFDVVDPCLGDSVRGDYVGDWGGYVRPMLSWTISSTSGGAKSPA